MVYIKRQVEAGGGERGGEEGEEEKGRRRGEENAFQLGITCRLTHTHAQQLCQSNAPWHVRGQITRERYKNAFNSGLVLRAERKCLRTKGVDLQLLVLPANLCQPVFLEKNAVSFGKQRSLARPGYEEVLRVTKTLHNGTFLVTRALVLLCERTAVRLATRVCRCWISQTEENKTPL